MEAPPAWRQGGGRGRGRARMGAGGGVPPAGNGPGGGRGKARGGAVVSMVGGSPNSGVSQANELVSQKKFDEIKKANQAAAKKFVENQFSSSSEDDDEEIDGKHGKILDKTFTTYTNQMGGDASELERTRQYMNDAFQSGAMTCLICIASVKRNQAVTVIILHVPCYSF